MILVTGGAGHIESHCVKELLDQAYDVLAFDNLSQGRRDAVLSKHFVEADLRDAAAVADVFRTHEIEAVIHFAGLIQVGESILSPLDYYENNILGTWSLLRATVDHGVERIVFSSSAAVYGVPEQTPIPEDHPKNPINPYGRTKWIVEQMLGDCARAYGTRHVALRYSMRRGATLMASWVKAILRRPT